MQHSGMQYNEFRHCWKVAAIDLHIDRSSQCYRLSHPCDESCYLSISLLGAWFPPHRDASVTTSFIAGEHHSTYYHREICVLGGALQPNIKERQRRATSMTSNKEAMRENAESMQFLST